MIRIVGLSATLPNYIDVARFLRVNPHIGLFFFDSQFRPVPLSMSFIGVKAIKPLEQMMEMDNVCYEKVVEMVQRNHQVSIHNPGVQQIIKNLSTSVLQIAVLIFSYLE